MTLIAYMCSGDTHLLVSDMLVTTPVKPPDPVMIPSHGDINDKFVGRPNFYVGALKQKITLLSDRLAVAWSGPVDRARYVLDGLSKIARREDLNSDTVRGALDKLDESWHNKLALVGLIHHPSDRGSDVFGVENFSVNAKKIHGGSLFQNLVVSGTGSDLFVQTLVQLRSELNKIKQQDGSSFPAFAGALYGVTALLGEEIRTGHTIIEQFGGAYEILTMGQDGFERVGGRLHLHFCASLSSGSIGLHVPLIQKLGYWQGNCVIEVDSMRRPLEPGQPMVGDRHEIFLCQSILPTKVPNMEEVMAVPLSHTTVCCSIEFEGDDKILALVFANQDVARVRFEGPRLLLSIHDDVFQAVANSVRGRPN